MEKLLEIKNVNIKFAFPSKALAALDDFSLTLHEGERVGLVGESGAGKSIAVFSIINLLRPPGKITSGSIFYKGEDLAKATKQRLQEIRGHEIAMIFQDPSVSLNPVFTVGQHLMETLLAHKKVSRREAYDRSIEAMEKVKIPSPEERMQQYPRDFSGGMRQRIIIACALITKPKIIIADEPTTALDVTLQAEIMELLHRLSIEEKLALLLVSHDLAMVSQVCQRIFVLYAGEVVEARETKELIRSPRHPYTKGLLECLPQNHTAGNLLQQIPGRMPSLEEKQKNLHACCSFHERCAYAKELCRNEKPVYSKTDSSSGVRCFFPLD